MAGALMGADRELIVLCSDVRYFDDTGIALLLALAHYANRYQVRVVLDRPPEALRRRLEIAGLAWLFDLRPCYVGQHASA
jgi:anti-anti-sigma factor